MSDTVSTTDLLARLEALAARLDEQAADIARLTAENARLQQHLPPAEAVVRQPARAPSTNRRRLLRGVLGATVAAALLAVSREVAVSEAATLTTVLSPSSSTASYGLVATAGGGSPSGSIFNLGSFSFGLIGVGLNPVINAPASAGVLGMDYFNHGVQGLSREGVGVYGESLNFQGVRGVSTNGTGVRGTSGSSYGAWGYSGRGTGVYGSTDSGIGVYGTSPSVYGVHGLSSSGAGVFGVSNTGFGVYGYSYGSGGAAVGLYGVANSGEGLVGLTQTGIGVHGNAVQSGLAGRFDGRVVVNGTLTVTGGLTTSAIASSDGDYRRMYSQESPEPWVEDFGTATLQNGRAEVALDPALDALVESTEYLVFLTPKGAESGPLYVSRQGEHAFEVRSYAGPTASGAFDYRVVARRRDVPGQRLERVPAANVNQGKDSPPPPAPRTAPDARPAPNGPSLRPDAPDRPRP
jgi:hypothetical protein